jgi:alpha-tubulin suppressor-like RCC1 family protein
MSSNHSFFLDGSRKIIFGCGRASRSQSAYDRHGHNHTPLPIHSNVTIQNIVCGRYSTIILDENGYTWIADVRNAEQPTQDQVIQPSMFPPALGVAISDARVLVITLEGQVISYNRQANHTFTSTNLTFLDKTRLSVRVTAVACGLDHNLAVDNHGNCWGWGDNSCGQLGFAIGDCRTVPTLIPGLSLTQEVSCGSYHSCVLDHLCQVRAFGLNDFGQLGIHGSEVKTSKTRCSLPRKWKDQHLVIAISCGGYHTLALDCHGQVLVCGSNRDGQLGLGNKQRRLGPVVMSGLSDICDILAGYKHSLACDSQGQIWVWGSNNFGQLGLGDYWDRVWPQQVKLPSEHRPYSLTRCLLPAFLDLESTEESTDLTTNEVLT